MVLGRYSIGSSRYFQRTALEMWLKIPMITEIPTQNGLALEI